MSIWQFNSAISGYIKANTPSDPKKFSSEEELEEMFQAVLNRQEKRLLNLKSSVYIFDGSTFKLERVVGFKFKE